MPPGHASSPGGQGDRHGVGNGWAIIVACLLLFGLWRLPDLMPPATSPLALELAHGRVVGQGAEAAPGGVTLRVQVLDGPREGQILDASAQGPSGSHDVQIYRNGDEVILSMSPSATGPFVAVSDRWRAPALGWMLGLFAAAVTLVGGWRGIRSLLALAFTLGVMVRVVVPLLLAGWAPIPVAVVAAAAVNLATILLTEGVRRTTLAAVAGTFAALCLTAVLAAAATAIAGFTATQGDEALGYLQSMGLGGLDAGGLLLAAVIFGALGVLDDVTVTQAATVEELAAADPAAPRRRVFWRAMNVGRSHIAATVNTLVLAYAGASLPLLVLFAAGRQDPLLIASGEVVAVEVVRTLAGSLGIVAAVPLTTLIAALALRPKASTARGMALTP